MSDEEVIKRAWHSLDPTLRARIGEYDAVVRDVPPLSPQPISASEDGLEPANDTVDAIEYAAGPFGTIVGRWRGVVTLV